MLKNMKVRTKLIAVLLAPVLVLVLLATIGVSQRLAVASGAQRVQELAQMAQTSANLAHELQAEAYDS
jgi:CHASE3 domain sensor protein